MSSRRRLAALALVAAVAGRGYAEAASSSSVVPSSTKQGQEQERIIRHDGAAIDAEPMLMPVDGGTCAPLW